MHHLFQATRPVTKNAFSFSSVLDNQLLVHYSDSCVHNKVGQEMRQQLRSSTRRHSAQDIPHRKTLSSVSLLARVNAQQLRSIWWRYDFLSSVERQTLEKLTLLCRESRFQACTSGRIRRQDSWLNYCNEHTWTMQ